MSANPQIWEMEVGSLVFSPRSSSATQQTGKPAQGARVPVSKLNPDPKTYSATVITVVHTVRTFSFRRKFFSKGYDSITFEQNPFGSEEEMAMVL